MPHSQDTRHMRYETLYIMLLIFASGLFPGGRAAGYPGQYCTGPDPHRDDGGPLITDYVRLAGGGQP